MNRQTQFDIERKSTARRYLWAVLPSKYLKKAEIVFEIPCKTSLPVLRNANEKWLLVHPSRLPEDYRVSFDELKGPTDGYPYIRLYSSKRAIISKPGPYLDKIKIGYIKGHFFIQYNKNDFWVKSFRLPGEEDPLYMTPLEFSRKIRFLFSADLRSLFLTKA